MPRQKEPYVIPTKTEEPQRIFVISVEGSKKKSEHRYLSLLKSKFNLNVKYEFAITPARDEAGYSSDPQGVLNRLEEKKADIATFDKSVMNAGFLWMLTVMFS